MKLDGDVIADVSFTGQGCAISKASASLMTAAVKGKSRAEAEALFDRFHQLVMGQLPESSSIARSLRAFAACRVPAARECASLAWHALHSALAARPVSTEHEPARRWKAHERFDISPTSTTCPRHARRATIDGEMCLFNYRGRSARSATMHAREFRCPTARCATTDVECVWHGARFDCRRARAAAGRGSVAVFRSIETASAGRAARA